MANSGFWDLIGTSFNYLRIGLTGFRLKNNSGVAQIRNAGDSEHADFEALTVAVKETGAANLFKFIPSTMAGNITLALPPDDGSPGYVLTTDGAGVATWEPGTAGGLICTSEAFNQATSSPLAIFTPPANAVIERVTVDVESAAGGGSPTIEVGIAGNTGKYMPTTANNLKEALPYTFHPEYEEDASPDSVIATIVPSAQTFSGFIRIYYTVPV